MVVRVIYGLALGSEPPVKGTHTAVTNGLLKSIRKSDTRRYSGNRNIIVRYEPYPTAPYVIFFGRRGGRGAGSLYDGVYARYFSACLRSKKNPDPPTGRDGQLKGQDIR